VVALTGFMASGKSTVGRSLTKLLKWGFIDLDYEVERRASQSIAEIFAQHGEARFRELEAQALRSLLENIAGPTVIALGGGTYVQPRNAALLRAHGVRVVFLELPLEQLLQRCRAADERPACNPRPLAKDERALRALHAERLPFYLQAEIVVNTEAKTPEVIAQEIAQVLRLSVAANRER